MSRSSASRTAAIRRWFSSRAAATWSILDSSMTLGDESKAQWCHGSASTKENTARPLIMHAGHVQPIFLSWICEDVGEHYMREKMVAKRFPISRPVWKQNQPMVNAVIVGLDRPAAQLIKLKLLRLCDVAAPGGGSQPFAGRHFIGPVVL